MDLDNYVSFIPVSDGDNQVIARNLTSLLSLATQAANFNQNQSQHSLESFKFDKQIDPSLVNIKEFADNFKSIKSKLAEIEKVITDLEKKKQQIKQKYDEVHKILTEFFNINDTNDVYLILQSKACEMISKLELEKYYDEQNKLLQHYKVAVPLLNEVKDEFFKDIPKIANCPICFEKDVSYAVYPCGHLTCEDCKKKIVSNCFQCRTHVLKVMRIYPS